MDFNKYVKHERYYGNHIYQYHHKEVEKRFYEVLNKLGEPNGLYDAVFITLRLKSKADRIIACSASNGFEWKLCKYFWGNHKGKKMLKSHSVPFVSSIESNLIRFKDHIHALILLKDLKKNFSHSEIEKSIKEIALGLDEVNSRDPTAVEIRIFPFSDKTEEHSKSVGDTIEYICKTASKHYNPLERIIFSEDPNKVHKNLKSKGIKTNYHILSKQNLQSIKTKL